MPQVPTKAKRKGLDLAEPAIKEIETECLIVGGGAAGCGSAVEATDEEIKNELYQPWSTFKEHAGVSTDPEVNPDSITPANFMERIMKVSDESGGGTSTYYTTNKESLEEGIRYLDLLEQDSQKLAARDLHCGGGIIISQPAVAGYHRTDRGG